MLISRAIFSFHFDCVFVIYGFEPFYYKRGVLQPWTKRFARIKFQGNMASIQCYQRAVLICYELVLSCDLKYFLVIHRSIGSVIVQLVQWSSRFEVAIANENMVPMPEAVWFEVVIETENMVPMSRSCLTIPSIPISSATA